MENIYNDMIIIIQGRLSSSRLPKKILLPIYKENCIIDILLERLSKNKYKIPVCLATTNNKNDNELYNKYKNNRNILCYRGLENNVLYRFIDCSQKFKKNIIIRVCSDNPFLSLKYIEELIEIYIKNGQQYDYLSFGLNKKPSILTHIGIFSELVTLETLIKIKQKTSEKKYLEHVTSYLYNNPDKFKIYLINKKYNGEHISQEITQSVITFLFIFIVTFIVLSVLLSFTGLDLITSFSAAATSISNVGPGLGSMIGPSYNFYEISDIGKWLLSAGMLAGRLEFLTLIVVFNKSFWK